MISGFECFRLCIAFKLHFSSDKYDIFDKKGGVRATQESFDKRKDRMLYIKLGKNFKQKKHLSECIVANYAYGNGGGIVYNMGQTFENHKEWLKRKQSISKIFQDDMTMFNNISDPNEIFTAPMCIESKVILNSLFHFVDDVQSNPLTSDRIRLIRKLGRFVKYDENRIKSVMKVVVALEENFNI